MFRLLERSDPTIQYHQKKIKNEVKCNKCELKHKTKNHEKYALLSYQTVLNEYDTLVSNFYRD